MSSSVDQDILRTQPPRLPVRRFAGRHLADAASAIQRLAPSKLGFATQLSDDGHICALAFATPAEIFHLAATPAPAPAPAADTGTDAPHQTRGARLSSLLSGGEAVLAGFAMARQALHVRRDLGAHVRGVDLSTVLAPSTRVPWSPADFIKNTVGCAADKFGILELWYPSDNEEEATRRLCLRAWLSALCAEHVGDSVQVDTRNLREPQLVCLGRLFHCVELLERAKPLRAENEFKGIERDENTGALYLQNARFKTRVRRSENTQIIMETAGGQRVVGQAIQAEGKQTTIQLTQGHYRGGIQIQRIRVEGREEQTCAENARDEFVLRLLLGQTSLAGRAFIDLLWFPPEDFRRRPRPTHAAPAAPAFEALNASQREVAAAMISATEPLVVAHGPPGTGKTTTISAAVKWWRQDRKPVWIVAQSNVGVKNIARSLIGKKFFGFKLLVSKEFYVEWHEDLYEQVEANLIRADDLFRAGDLIETERKFGGCRIVLCTLSMLSNPALDDYGVFKLIPMERLVVDEASQIDVSQYMHLCHKFNKLQKICLFGDPKQLPPFGKDAAPDLQSIFDIKHLKPRAYFLNTQYRMPTPLGNFISHHVYDKKLRSVHKIDNMSCIAFIDAWKGCEESVGKSWKNQEEVQVVVSLVKNYYGKRDFCIITPYDAQRAAITKALESHDLPSDRVYNVDSFQGHEAPFVILSAVRTTRPGFLALQERTNVMLTRCTTGMVVVTHSGFVRRSPAAEKTLLGKLARHWEEHAGGEGGVWVDWRDVSAQTADLPGVRAPRRPRPVAAQPGTDTIGGLVSKRPAASSVTVPAPAPLPASAVSLSRTAREAQAVAGESAAELLNTRFRGMSLSTRNPKQTLVRKAPADDFPVLGARKAGHAAKNNLKGRWRNGSEAVKYCW